MFTQTTQTHTMNKCINRKNTLALYIKHTWLNYLSCLLTPDEMKTWTANNVRTTFHHKAGDSTHSTYIMQRYLHQTTIYFIFKLSLRFYCFTIVLIAINVMPLRSSVGAIEISDNDDEEYWYFSFSRRKSKYIIIGLFVNDEMKIVL